MDRPAVASRKLTGSVDGQEVRAWCGRCRRPAVTCFCRLVEPFDSEPRFVILSQPRETKHRLGTGRMAHLNLANSLWYEGVDFSQHAQVNQVIGDTANAAMLLYPGPEAINLTRLDLRERRSVATAGRTVVVFVLDGTWKSVRKMLRLSDNLRRLPRICFEPSTPSAYGFRREPRPECYSTIEAIHQVIELFNEPANPGVAPRRHDHMLQAFHFMVATQLAYSPD